MSIDPLGFKGLLPNPLTQSITQFAIIFQTSSTFVLGWYITKALNKTENNDAIKGCIPVIAVFYYIITILLDLFTAILDIKPASFLNTVLELSLFNTVAFNIFAIIFFIRSKLKVIKILQMYYFYMFEII